MKIYFPKSVMLLFYIYTLLLIGCQKQVKKTKVKGMVEDMYSHQPIPGIRVNLEVSQDGSNCLGSSDECFIVDYKYADAKGNFNFVFKGNKYYLKDNNWSYVISVNLLSSTYLNPYWDKYFSGASANVIQKKENDITLQLISKAQLTIKAVDVDSADGINSIKVTYPISYNGYLVTTVLNSDDSMTKTESVAGNKYQTITWVRAGAEFIDSVYTPQFNTVTYTIQY